MIDDRCLRRNLPELEPLERQGLAIVLEKITNFRGGLQLEVASRIAAEGASSTPTTLLLATRLVAAARAQAVHEILLGVYVSPFDQPLEQDEGAITGVISEAATAAPCGEVAQTSLIVPTDWKNKTAYQIAELIIETNPQLLAHRTNGKRGAAQTGEQTKRQILWAAKLLDKSMNRPFWTRTRGRSRVHADQNGHKVSAAQTNVSRGASGSGVILIVWPRIV